MKKKAQTVVKILLIGVIIIFAFMFLVLAVGTFLPKEHTAKGEAVFKASPEEVWKVVHDYKGMSEWWPEIGRINKSLAIDDKPTFKSIREDGFMLFVFEEVDPPKRFKSVVAGGNTGFEGSWTYELEPEGTGCRLTVTEEGIVHNGLFRVIVRVTGTDGTIQEYLAALRKKLGEN